MCQKEKRKCDYSKPLLALPIFFNVCRLHFLISVSDRKGLGEREKEMKMDHAPLYALLELVEESPVKRSWMKEVVDDLALLKAYLMDPPQQLAQDGTLKKVECLASEVGSIISSSDLKEMDEYMAYRLELQLNFALRPMFRWMYPARRIYDNKPKPSRVYFPRTDQIGFLEHLVVILEVLVKGKADKIGLLKRYILKLLGKLKFVSSRLMEVPEGRKEEADLKDLITSITNLAYEVEYVIDSFLVGDIPIWCCMYWLFDILKEFKHKKRLVKMECGDMQSLLSSIVYSVPEELNIIPIVSKSEMNETLMEVFNDRSVSHSFDVRSWSLVSSYKHRKKEVFLQLLHNASYAPYQHMMEFVKKEYISDMSEDELEKWVYKLLKNKEYFIILEDVQDIDTLNDIRRVLPDDRNGSRILLTTHFPELAVQCRYGSQKVFFNKMSEDHTSTSHIDKPITDDDMVGFKEETERILDWLTRESEQLLIISIVGMAGQGKTTLAKQLYNHVSIVDYFDARAWCGVSQVYEKRELLLELLSQLIQQSETIHHKNEVELSELLCKYLRGRRFLVVLDDMWSIGAWNDLRRCLPNDKNGSRIIFTTRLQLLASQVQSRSMLQPLGPLSDDESWELLRKKVFQKKSCPPELTEVGIQIAKNCKGLPLAVVLIAGLLAKMEKTEGQWKQIAETLSSHILDAEAHGKGIIELSYKHLPDHLKPCFLYFGGFLVEKEVPVGKLIQLWVAEGSIKYNNLKSLEDVAEDYLMDLIGRSLVTVAQEKSSGGVKSCRIHDLLHEFCLAKAEEEKFLQAIHGYDEHFLSLNDNLNCSMDPNNSGSSTPIIYNQRRMCIYSKRNHFLMLKPSGPLVRSLLFFPASDMSTSDSHDISFISLNFKLLKILDLEDIIIGHFFEAISILIHLRYLAVQGYIDYVPSSIANLCNLETLCIKALQAKVVKVPDSIWDLVKLRHVHITENASFNINPHRLENSSILENLLTFSTLSLAYGDNTEGIMRKLSRIKKLRCVFLDSRDEVGNQLPVLGFLSQLVSLKVFYNGERRYPCEFSFPPNLKKLTLSKFRMSWNQISQLANLCNLEVLKLLCGAFEGEKWQMEDEMFPKLKFLKLDTLNIVEWSATSDHFPRLERLLLHKCEQLEEIPPDIGDIPTLQMIEVMWCNPSAATSARKIQEEQWDFGNEGLKINVRPKLSNLESSS